MELWIYVGKQRVMFILIIRSWFLPVSVKSGLW